uniref:Uncharacterized protein n=1 Tax=Zea mays TaxID=4577 RepID=B8A3T2_MAIZE|nr:unknown [Zea mays]
MARLPTSSGMAALLLLVAFVVLPSAALSSSSSLLHSPPESDETSGGSEQQAPPEDENKEKERQLAKEKAYAAEKVVQQEMLKYAKEKGLVSPTNGTGWYRGIAREFVDAHNELRALRRAAHEVGQPAGAAGAALVQRHAQGLPDPPQRPRVRRERVQELRRLERHRQGGRLLVGQGGGHLRQGQGEVQVRQGLQGVRPLRAHGRQEEHQGRLRTSRVLQGRRLHHLQLLCNGPGQEQEQNTKR